MTVVLDDLYQEDPDTPIVAKPGPVVVRRKREGIQLCKVYDPAKPPKWTSVYFEPKFDGYRCLMTVQNGRATALTSTGLPHWNVNHILCQVENAAKRFPIFCDNVMLDGELLHNTLDFDTAGGILRKHNSDPRAIEFVFHVWDALPLEAFQTKTCEEPLITRKTRLMRLMADLTRYGSYVQEVNYKTGPIYAIEEFAREFVIEDGMEGIIAKDANGLYQFKKSGVWLKWKPKFETDGVKEMKEGDFRITGMKPGRGKHQGRLGAILIEGYLLEDGNIAPDPPEDEPIVKLTGKAGTGFNDQEREEFQRWAEAGTLIGRCVECRYQELSSKSAVRFPVFSRLRADKD